MTENLDKIVRDKIKSAGKEGVSALSLYQQLDSPEFDYTSLTEALTEIENKSVVDVCFVGHNNHKHYVWRQE